MQSCKPSQLTVKRLTANVRVRMCRLVVVDSCECGIGYRIFCVLGIEEILL